GVLYEARFVPSLPNCQPAAQGSQTKVTWHKTSIADHPTSELRGLICLAELTFIFLVGHSAMARQIQKCWDQPTTALFRPKLMCNSDGHSCSLAKLLHDE